MEIKRVGSQASGKGPWEWFTGRAPCRSPVHRAGAGPRCRRKRHLRARRANRVAHAPAGADVDCHRGLRLGAAEGAPVEEIHPGDVVWFPRGEKHWHGATAATAMSHITIQKKLDGKTVDWMEKVTDESTARPRAAPSPPRRTAGD